MSKIDNPTTKTTSPTNDAAIEVYDGGTINIGSGNLIVSGTATVSCVLSDDGTTTLSGTFATGGHLRIFGATNIAGAAAHVYLDPAIGAGSTKTGN